MTDSPLDYSVKKNLLRDTIHILNLTQKRKNKYLNTIRNDVANRLVGKHRLSQNEREVLKEKKMRIKDKYENNNLGDFQNLYPLKRGVTVKNDILMDAYDMIHKKAREIYEDSTAGKNSYYRNKKEEKIEAIPVVDKKLDTMSNITVQLPPKKKKSQMNVTNNENHNKDQTRRSNQQQTPLATQKKSNTTTSTFKFSQGGCNQLIQDNNTSKKDKNNYIGKDGVPGISSSVHLQITSQPNGGGGPRQNIGSNFSLQSQMSLTQKQFQKKSGMEDNIFNKRGDQWYDAQGQLFLHQDLMKQMEASFTESNKIFMEGAHLHQQNLMLSQNPQLGQKFEMPFRLKHPTQQQLQQQEGKLPACNQFISNEVVSNEFPPAQVQNAQILQNNDTAFKHLRKSNNSQSYGQKQNDFLQMCQSDKKAHPSGGFDHNSQFELLQAPQHSSRTIDPTNFHYSQQQYGQGQATQNVGLPFPNDVIGSLNIQRGNYQLGQGTGQGTNNASKQTLPRPQQFGNLQGAQFYHHSNTASKNEGPGPNFMGTPSRRRNQFVSQYFPSNQKSQFASPDDVQGNPAVLDYIQQSVNNGKAQAQQFNAPTSLSDSLELIAQTNLKHKVQQQSSKTAPQQNQHLKNGCYTSPSNLLPSSQAAGLNEQSNALIQQLGMPVTTSKKNKPGNNNQAAHKQSQSRLPSNLKSPSLNKNDSSSCLQPQFEARSSQPNTSNCDKIQHTTAKQQKDRNIGSQNSVTATRTGNVSSKANRKSTYIETEQHNAFSQNFHYIQNDAQNKFPTVVNSQSISQKGGIMQIMQIQNMHHNLQPQLHLPPHSVQKGPSSKLQQHPQQHPLKTSLQHDNPTFQMAGIDNPSLINGVLYMPKNYSKNTHINMLDVNKKSGCGGYISSSLAEGGQGIVDNNKQRGKSMILNKQQGKSSVNQNIFSPTVTQGTNEINLQRPPFGGQQQRSGTGQKVHMPTIIDKTGQNSHKTPNQHKNYNFEQMLFADNQKYSIQASNKNEGRVGYTQSHDNARPKPNDYNIMQPNNQLSNQLDLRQ